VAATHSQSIQAALDVLRMNGTKPPFDLGLEVTDFSRQFASFSLRDFPASIVRSHVPFRPAALEVGSQFRGRFTHEMWEKLEDHPVMTCPMRLVSSTEQGDRRQRQCGIVGDQGPTVRRKTCNFCVRQVPLGYSLEVCRISSLRVLRGLNRPSARNLSKLIFTPYQEDLGPLQHIQNEGIPSAYFFPEFRRRHRYDIDLASECMSR